MMLKKLRLHREASRKLSTINTITDIAEHKVIGCRHLVHAKFVEQTASPGLGNSVGERTGVHSRMGDDSGMGGVLLNELFAAVLHVEVLGLGDCVVVGDDDSTEGSVDVAGVWEAAAAVAEPEKIPARKVAVGRVYRFGRSVIVDVEVCVALIWVWLRVCWVQVLVGCVFYRLDDQSGRSSKILHLSLYSEIPVDVILEDESGCEVLLYYATDRLDSWML
jgi:hypothetical protein